MDILGEAWPLPPAMLTPGRQQQEDLEFKANLGYLDNIYVCIK